MRNSPPIIAPSLPSTSPPTTSRSPSMRAPRSRITSPLIASTRPRTCPPNVSGPFRTATSPATSRPASIAIRSVARSVVVALNSATTSCATSRGSSSRTGRLSRCCACSASGTQAPIRVMTRVRIVLTDDGSGVVPRLESFVADRDPEPAHPSIQVGPVGLQPTRCLGHVASRRRQCAHDEHPLVLVQRIAEGAVERRGIRQRLGASYAAVDGQHGAHVLLVDIPAGVQDRQPLDDVRQLAHVARPSVARQQCEGTL